MKFDFENGLPVWVWGIAFLLVVLPFSFRPNSDSAQLAPNLTGESSLTTDPVPTAEPTPPPDPEATLPIIIEIAPAPSDGYPEPVEPEAEGANQGYE